MRENKPQVLEVGSYYVEHVWRDEEYKAVGKAYTKGYTEVLQDKESDEVVYLVKPEDLEGKELDHRSWSSLKASLEKYFTLTDLYEWARQN